jgi:hypothetical protein
MRYPELTPCCSRRDVTEDNGVALAVRAYSTRSTMMPSTMAWSLPNCTTLAGGRGRHRPPRTKSGSECHRSLHSLGTAQCASRRLRLPAVLAERWRTHCSVAHANRSARRVLWTGQQRVSASHAQSLKCGDPLRHLRGDRQLRKRCMPLVCARRSRASMSWRRDERTASICGLKPFP